MPPEPTLSLERLEELERIARAATPGPWRLRRGSETQRPYQIEGAEGTAASADRPLMRQGIIAWGSILQRASATGEANALHMAAFDPPTVLALLTLARRAQGAWTEEDVERVAIAMHTANTVGPLPLKLPMQPGDYRTFARAALSALHPIAGGRDEQR